MSIDTDTVARMQKRLNALPSQENAVCQLRHTITSMALKGPVPDAQHDSGAADVLARAHQDSMKSQNDIWEDIDGRRRAIFREAVGCNYVPGKPRQDYMEKLPKPDREEVKMLGRVRIADPPPMFSPAALAQNRTTRVVYANVGPMASPTGPVAGDAKLTERDALAGIFNAIPTASGVSALPQRVDPEDHLVGEALVAPQTREAFASLSQDATWTAITKTLTNIQRNATSRSVGKADILQSVGLRTRTPHNLVRTHVHERERAWDAAVDAEEYQTRANDAPTPIRQAEFVRQIHADLKNQLQKETIYADLILDEASKTTLKQHHVRGDGLIRQEYVPASTHQVPPPRVGDLSHEEREILQRRMAERGVIFKAIAEQNARQFKTGVDGYEKRNMNKGLQMHMEGPDVPLTTMERLRHWMQQFPDDAMTEGKGIYRPCSRGESCIGRNITRAHLGLATASRNAVSQTVMSGYTTLQAQTSPHNAAPPVKPNPSEMGFILAAYMTDEEVDYCKRTHRRFDNTERTCVLCHICEVSQQYDNITETENLPVDLATGAVRPLNLFRVEVDRPGAYSSSVCLQSVASWGFTGIVGHFPRFSCEHYGYGERVVDNDKTVKCIIEHGMGFRPSSAK